MIKLAELAALIKILVIWSAPRERRGRMQNFMPFNDAVVVVDNRVLPPPVGLIHSVLIYSFFSTPSIIRVPISVC